MILECVFGDGHRARRPKVPQGTQHQNQIASLLFFGPTRKSPSQSDRKPVPRHLAHQALVMAVVAHPLARIVQKADVDGWDSTYRSRESAASNPPGHG